MADVSFVTPWLAVGGAIASEGDIQDIVSKGITHVVNCRVGFDDDQLLRGRARYLWNPAPDDRKPKAPEWFIEAIEFTRRALANADAKVLVHCTGGTDRAPSIAYTILRAMGYSRADAETAVLSGRPGAQLPYQEDGEAALRQLAERRRAKENDVA